MSRFWKSARWPTCWRCVPSAKSPRSRWLCARSPSRSCAATKRRPPVARRAWVGSSTALLKDDIMSNITTSAPSLAPANDRSLSEAQRPEQHYAISTYPDTDAIYARLNALVRQPMRTIRRDRMQAVLDYFTTSCAGSKALTDEAKCYIPGGVQHNLAFNYPFPIAIERADGAHLWDVDGNQYIDFLQAGGPTVLGSNCAP